MAPLRAAFSPRPPCGRGSGREGEERAGAACRRRWTCWSSEGASWAVLRHTASCGESQGCACSCSSSSLCCTPRARPTEAAVSSGARIQRSTTPLSCRQDAAPLGTNTSTRHNVRTYARAHNAECVRAVGRGRGRVRPACDHTYRWAGRGSALQPAHQGAARSLREAGRGARAAHAAPDPGAMARARRGREGWRASHAAELAAVGVVGEGGAGLGQRKRKR